MVFTQSDLATFRTLLEGAKAVRCICHRNPDGDAIGSMLGIGWLIEQHYPSIQVSFHCVDPVPEI
ncbi:hypothetical protein HZA45_02005, partial [Candidatus Peregrinibacteria bacterium]|nr:hypothetical protein [Candidatus Peregrinibacteria bacterium]